MGLTFASLNANLRFTKETKSVMLRPESPGHDRAMFSDVELSLKSQTQGSEPGGNAIQYPLLLSAPLLLKVAPS